MTINGRLPTRLIIALIGVLFSSVATGQEGNLRADAKNPELDRARQLIRETPRPGLLHNPVRVIRSVNCLHSLGKKQAISLLLEVSSPKRPLSIITDADGNPVDEEQRKHYRYDQTVCMIVPLLFDIPAECTPPPDAWYCKRSGCWRWAAGTQVVQGGIPFAITGEWDYGGRPYATRPLVEWAAKHGRLRAKRLHPEDNPLQAADALCDRLKSGVVGEFEQLYGVDESTRAEIAERLRSDLRGQAVRMLHNGMRDVKALEWDEMCETVVRLGIRWDPKREMHMLADRQNGR